MIYLALDQALKTSGFALFNNEKPIKWGTFETNATLPIEQRLGTIWTQLNQLTDKTLVDHVFLEDVQKQANVQTYQKLCFVQAAIYLWCYFNNLKCSTLGPSHWRKIIKDNYKVSFGKVRAEQKKAAQDFVKKHFDISATEDECDAICLGLAGIQERKRNESAF